MACKYLVKKCKLKKNIMVFLDFCILELKKIFQGFVKRREPFSYFLFTQNYNLVVSTLFTLTKQLLTLLLIYQFSKTNYFQEYMAYLLTKKKLHQINKVTSKTETSHLTNNDICLLNTTKERKMQLNELYRVFYLFNIGCLKKTALDMSSVN